VKMPMFGSAHPEHPFPPRKEAAAETDPTVAGSPGANGDYTFEGHELDAALQLLVERAQYITGATGAALAIAQDEEMVCRASVGSPGPAVGARLQVRSGLSGESISRKQLLRCDNAETDPRVVRDERIDDEGPGAVVIAEREAHRAARQHVPDVDRLAPAVPHLIRRRRALSVLEGRHQQHLAATAGDAVEAAPRTHRAIVRKRD